MEFVKKYGGYIVAGIVAIVLAVAVLQYTGNKTKKLEDSEVVRLTDKYNEDWDPERASDLNAQEKMLSVAVPLTVGILVFLSLLTLGLTVFNFIQTPQKIVKFLIPFSIMMLFLLITYMTASDDVTEIDTKVPFTATEYKVAGAIMSSTFILIILGLASFVGLRVYKLVKK